MSCINPVWISQTTPPMTEVNTHDTSETLRLQLVCPNACQHDITFLVYTASACHSEAKRQMILPHGRHTIPPKAQTALIRLPTCSGLFLSH